MNPIETSEYMGRLEIKCISHAGENNKLKTHREKKNGKQNKYKYCYHDDDTGPSARVPGSIQDVEEVCSLSQEETHLYSVTTL